jgi:viroplasmin and RNaseH domain-containing protein
LVSNFRYLGIDENERFLKIVYDHNSKKHAWVLKKQLNERFYLKMKYINDLKTNSGEFLSLFGLTTTNCRKIYNRPTDDSDFEIIYKKDFSNKFIKITEQKNDFLKIAIINEDCDNNIEIIKELGWVKIKNNTGALNIWIINIDVC